MSHLQQLIETVQRNNFVVLDTETTGLDHRAEVIQLAILSSDGMPILDTLIKPMRPIPPDASRIHGITDDHVKDAPILRDLMDCLFTYIEGRDVVIYNSSFDVPMLRQTFERHGFGMAWTVFRESMNSVSCAMLAYAEHRGDWNDYYQNYRWHRLAQACENEGVAIADAHQAMGDCKMTLALIKHLAAIKTQEGK